MVLLTVPSNWGGGGGGTIFVQFLYSSLGLVWLPHLFNAGRTFDWAPDSLSSRWHFEAALLWWPHRWKLFWGQCLLGGELLQVLEVWSSANNHDISGDLLHQWVLAQPFWMSVVVPAHLFHTCCRRLWCPMAIVYTLDGQTSNGGSHLEMLPNAEKNTHTFLQVEN